MNPKMMTTSFAIWTMGIFSLMCALLEFKKIQDGSVNSYPEFCFLLGFSIFLSVAGFWLATRDY